MVSGTPTRLGLCHRVKVSLSNLATAIEARRIHEQKSITWGRRSLARITSKGDHARPSTVPLSSR